MKENPGHISTAKQGGLTYCRGLDNAGKTTIVKKIMNEDVNTVSPTLGFVIKTIEYGEYVHFVHLISNNLTVKIGTS